MTDIEAENKLKRCLEATLNIVQTTIGQIESKKVSEDDSPLDAQVAEIPADTNIYSFTLDRWEENLMSDFKREVEQILNKQIPNLKPHCQAYLLDHLNLFNYNDVKKEFTDQLNIGMLDSFARELQSCLDSIDAYPAALNGKETEVKKFIEKYPAIKDKSGLWGTTLLYSAARNGHLGLVKDLIENHGCSINAQNQQHILRALAASGHGEDYYDANARAGSTALHSACYYERLHVIKYLIEHGADYYIKNQAGETAIMHVDSHQEKEISKYFRELLIFGYSSKLKNFPKEPIAENENSQIIDCIWEYNPFGQEKWFPFSPSESSKLQQSLILKSDQEFQREICLEVPKGVYGISLMKFLRSGRNLNYADKLAWVRCRGSSFLNFNCYALWQIFLTKHPKALPDSILDMINIPTSYDSRFKIHLSTWYFCNAQTNQQLDKAMKYRRKYVDIKVPFISNDSLTFNLENFSFVDEKNKITGFLRWVPKMISNNSRHKDKISDVDEYATMTNIDPIPLTTSRLKEVSKINDHMPTENEEELAEHMDDEDYSYEDCSNRNDDHPVDKIPDTPLNDTRSLTELFNIPPPLSGRKKTTDDAQINESMPEDEPEKSIDECINETNANISPSQQPVAVEKTNPSSDNESVLEATNKLLSELREKNDELEQNLNDERTKVQSLVASGVERNARYNEELNELFKRIDAMEKEKKINEEKEKKLRDTSKTIRTIEYTNIEKSIMQDFLTPKNYLIIDYLQRTNTNIDPSFRDRVPKMTSKQINNSYIVTVVGFSGHHDEFKAILRRIQILLNTIKSAKDFYQRYLNRTMYSIIKGVLPKVTPRTQVWREYTQLFVQLFKEKNTEYKHIFDDYIDEKLKSMINLCILKKLINPWEKFKEETDKFLKNQPFAKEINPLKQKALDEFIKENISLQRLKFESEPSQKSISTIENFIKKVQKELQTDRQYQGHEIKHFSLIPKLLERLLLYYYCFKIQLPLYESSDDLLIKIDDHMVTTIATSTGSGKSTLLPALLIAEGYDKVIVTQPRRLPCQLICKRVNETMMIDTGKSAKKLAGWAVSGAEKNPQAKVLYLTDGLLKERLLYDQNLITSHTELDKSVVFFIDEVHERSVNIDLCLALLARLLSIKPELRTKLKVIVSSATLDASVPNLFRRVLHGDVTEFKMPKMGTRYPVRSIAHPNENILDIVLELCKKRQRPDQILCFVSSVSEVNQCCRLIAEISRGTIVAYPLVQSQHPNVQQANIEHGTLFFSTTVAETSLTFPSLKYVVDTGMINTPVYDIESKRTILQEVRAAESTLKQRLGRLGRTQPGEYYFSYNFQPSAVPYPIPQICQSDLMNLEFSLRKSPLKKGLNYLKTFLPDAPSQPLMDSTLKQLKELDIIESMSADQLTAHGKELAKLPDFGSLAMSKSVLAALKTNKCGHDLICLASFLGVLNTTTIFRNIPQHFKSPDGDFMTLLNVINEILLVKESTPMKDAKIDKICQAKGLNDIQHIIKQVLKRYSTLQDSFKLCADFRKQAQQKSGNWELITKALLAGYLDNVFVSMKNLQGRTHHFVRYNNEKDIAVLDLQSTLTRPINSTPVSLVLARDIRRSTAVRATAILSFVGEIEPEWIKYKIKREFDVSDEEVTQLQKDDKYAKAVSKFGQVTMKMTGGKIDLEGTSGDVLNAELHLLQQMISESTFTLKSLANPNPHPNFERNLESLMKMTRIFNPLIWRWKAQKQADITINNNTATKICEIIVQGRDSVNKQVKEEFKSFIVWLQYCAVISHPNAGLSPRVLRPQMRSKCRDIEERIARITDSKRTPIDLYNGTKGVHATRETRMEVVAWIAICKFDCRLEGGFVRDWVVGHDTKRPTAGITNPKAWITYNGKIPEIHKEVVPCDLDCHLPGHAYFDIQKFQDELYKYGIICSVVRQDWRYVLLFDENETTGPFTMDLIEPHIALAQDRIDFDVNNLYVEKDYTHELGMRIDIAKKPYSIELETIVDNIKNTRFQILRPRDARMNERIDKMINIRKWEKLDQELSVIPEPHWKYHAVLVPLSSTAVLYQEIKNKMSVIPNFKIQSIEEIRNPFLEETYEGMKKIIKKQCKGANPNELSLFHGTKAEGIDGIVEDGFDDRYFTGGMYGHGAYFADNPLKSHDFTAPDPTNNTRVMYYNKVLIGKPHELTAANNDLKSAPKGFHSVIGRHSPRTEYIVYRYGQALPSKLNRRFFKGVQNSDNNQPVESDKKLTDYKDDSGNLQGEIHDYRNEYTNEGNNGQTKNHSILMNDEHPFTHASSFATVSVSDFELNPLNVTKTSLFSPSTIGLPNDDVQITKETSIKTNISKPKRSLLAQAYAEQEKNKFANP